MAGELSLPRFSVADLVSALDRSLHDLERGLSLVSPRWLGRHTPWDGIAARETPWSVATNLAHMAVYEELLAAPVLEAMAADGDGADRVPSGDEDWFTAGTEKLSEAAIEAILEELAGARARQITAVRAMSDEALNLPRTPLWGQCWGGLQPAGWVAMKTVQHTGEHGNSILQIALFAPR